jgi:glycosyltransferase involved in cell wall biosynthesis
MRLAYLTSRFPFAHLGETFLRPEVQLLSDLCDELHLIPARPAFRENPFGNLGSRDVYLPPAAASTLFAAAHEVLHYPRRAGRVLLRLLFSRYSTRAKIKNLALLPKALAVARYVRDHRIEHIHANWLTTSSTVAYVAHMMTGIPWSCTAHAHDIYSNNLTAQKVGSARFVRVISERNRNALNGLTGHAHDDRTYVGHLGVEIPQRPAPLSDRSNDITMVCPARLHPMKGHRDLLHALGQLRAAGHKFQCDLAGDGELRAELSTIIRELDLESCVTIRGTVAHGDLLAELRAGKYDAVVLASVEDPHERRFFEGIPVALIEAMAAGVPCISTRTGSISELIDERTGALVEQHSPSDFSAAMARLAVDPALRRRLGWAARDRVVAHFNASLTARALYDSIVAAASDSLGHSSAAFVQRPASMPAANAN